MVKLMIEMHLDEEDEFTKFEPYDKEKWRDGKIYEFNTLKEVGEFIDQCNEEIDFTEETYNRFGQWRWEEIDIDWYIDQSEDNFIKLIIGSHEDWRD